MEYPRKRYRIKAVPVGTGYEYIPQYCTGWGWRNFYSMAWWAGDNAYRFGLASDAEQFCKNAAYDDKVLWENRQASKAHKKNAAKYFINLGKLP